jgi:hypothetical protein
MSRMVRLERFSNRVAKPQIPTRSTVMCALRASENSFGAGCYISLLPRVEKATNPTAACRHNKEGTCLKS